MPKMYVIAGCNGAGKTTVANTLLPEYFNCTEFVNADLIDANPINAGRLTITLISRLIRSEKDFALETTLSGHLHRRLIEMARQYDYEIILIFTLLNSVDVALDRVQERVELGGHNIPKQDICRRYKRGIVNLFSTYIWLVDYWVITDTTNQPKVLVAEGSGASQLNVLDHKIWIKLKSKYNEYKSEA